MDEDHERRETGAEELKDGTEKQDTAGQDTAGQDTAGQDTAARDTAEQNPAEPDMPEPDMPEAELPEADASEQYAFMKETVKSRPIRVRRVIYGILGIIGAAVLFGLIAGGIILAMNPSSGNGQITIPSDDSSAPTPTASPVPTAVPTETPAVTQTPVPTPTAEITPAPTPEAEPTMTPEEEEEKQISDYRSLYATMEKIAAEPNRSVVTVTGVTSTEDLFNTINESSKSVSGLIIADNGQNLLILTDAVAAENMTKILTTFLDGSVAEASFQKKDPATGLCIITVPDSSLSAETLSDISMASLGNSNMVSQGQPVIAIGRPMGYSDSIVYGQITSVSNRISVLDGQYTLLTTNIQGSTDGSGILVNLDGDIVGIIMQEYSPAGSSTISGVPISPLKNLIEKLSNNTPLSYIGIRGEDISTQLSAQTGVPSGVYITSVDADSPALAAGVMTADVITELDGAKIDSMQSYRSVLLNKNPGDVVAIKVMRQGADGYVEFNFNITIGRQ